MVKLSVLWRITAALAWPGLVGIASACRCVEPIAPSPAYRHATTVVQGRVDGVKLNAADQSAIATITVTAAWKQAVPATIEVFTDTNCAYPFETGREYVLFLLKDRPLAGYVTGRCMGNQPAIQADTVLRWLRRNGAVRDVSPKP